MQDLKSRILEYEQKGDYYLAAMSLVDAGDFERAILNYEKGGARPIELARRVAEKAEEEWDITKAIVYYQKADEYELAAELAQWQGDIAQVDEIYFKDLKSRVIHTYPFASHLPPKVGADRAIAICIKADFISSAAEIAEEAGYFSQAITL